MKKSVSAWEERVAKERPKARSQPKYSWQVPVPTVDEKEDFQSTSTTDNFNLNDGLNDQNENDQVDQNDDHIDLSSINNTTVNIVTDTKKAPVTSAEKEPVTNTKKVPVQKMETSTKKVTDTEKVPVATFRIPHQELDYLFKELDTSEFKLYLRLYRLSHGWGQEICRVGDNNLMETLNMSKNSIRGAKQGLISKKLLEIIQIVNLGPKGYTEYRVIRTGEMLGQPNSNWYQKGTSSKKVTDTKKVPNKEDHDDDYLNKDHHQNKVVLITEHQQQVMMIYQKITENVWTKADSDTYMKIKNIPLEKIEIALRLASERAKNRPNSFAFFIKEILSVSSPKKQSRSQQKKAMEAIMNNIRNSKVGSSNYTISDFAFDVKEACIREDVTFDNNIFDELLAKQRT
jgi:hypothetical protein